MANKRAAFSERRKECVIEDNVITTASNAANLLLTIDGISISRTRAPAEMF